MKIAIAAVIIAAVCLFIYFTAKNGKFKEGECASCINCPIKDCKERKDAIKE